MARNGNDKAPQSSKASPQQAGKQALRVDLVESQFHFHQDGARALLVILAGLVQADVEDTIDHLNGWLDPRNIRIHAFDPEHDPLDAVTSRLYPPRWWFWQRMPAQGDIAIFLDGWYEFAFDPRRAAPPDHRHKFVRRTRFEQSLRADRVTTLKIWLDRSKASFAARLKALAATPESAWKITDRDRQIERDYDAYRLRIERIVENDAAPWTAIDMDQDEAFTDLSRLLDAALKTAPPPPPSAVVLPSRAASPPQLTAETIANGKSEAENDDELARLQGRIRTLIDSKGFRDQALIVVFEGLDAAGKGGTIRRLARSIDPRQLSVVPIAAPSTEDLRYPYLWRFWRHIPPRGNVTVFDRSWYGRVLVERVEELAARADWQRAYGEINEFEGELGRHGVILIKIWLQVSAEEQLKRFKERADTPAKHYKLTADDWRNFKKRDRYMEAAKDMLALTHTTSAPWTVIPSNDKMAARIATLRTIAERLEKVLTR